MQKPAPRIQLNQLEESIKAYINFEVERRVSQMMPRQQNNQRQQDGPQRNAARPPQPQRNDFKPLEPMRAEHKKPEPRRPVVAPQNSLNQLNSILDQYKKNKNNGGANVVPATQSFVPQYQQQRANTPVKQPDIQQKPYKATLDHATEYIHSILNRKRAVAQ